MNLQLLIIDTLRLMPKSLLRLLAGKPPTIDGHTLDLNMHMMANLAQRGGSPSSTLSPLEAIRESARAFNAMSLPIARGVSTEDTSFTLLGNRLKARVYRPKQPAAAAPAVLFFHQGGMVIMDHLTDNHFCSLLAARCGAVVISLDYRLCPEHDFPAPIDDAKALWLFVQDNARALGIDPHRVGLAGDSAGGLISTSLAITLREDGGTQPAALCLAYPWVTTDTDGQASLQSCADTFPLTAATMHFFDEQAFPKGRNKDSPLANPLHVENLQNLPPTVVGTAGFDPIRDQGDAFAERLTEAGNTVMHHRFTSLTHSFLMFGRVSRAATTACETLARDMAKLLS